MIDYLEYHKTVEMPPEEDAAPKGYARRYIRVSTDRQENSIEAQRARLEARMPALLADGYQDGGEYIDEAVSAKIELYRRRDGARLWRDLGKGDVVLFTHTDRGFRNMEDVARTMEVWVKLKVGMILLDIFGGQVNTLSSVGQMVIHMAVAFATFERRKISERTHYMYVEHRRQGIPWGSDKPHGFVVKTKWLKAGKRQRWFEPCQWDRTIGMFIVEAHDAGRTWEEIYRHLRDNSTKTKDGKSWSIWKIRRAYAEEKRLQAWEAKCREETRA